MLGDQDPSQTPEVVIKVRDVRIHPKYLRKRYSLEMLRDQDLSQIPKVGIQLRDVRRPGGSDVRR